MKAGAFAHQSDTAPNTAQANPRVAAKPSDLDAPSQDETSLSFASAFAGNSDEVTLDQVKAKPHSIIQANIIQVSENLPLAQADIAASAPMDLLAFNIESPQSERAQLDIDAALPSALSAATSFANLPLPQSTDEQNIEAIAQELIETDTPSPDVNGTADALIETQANIRPHMDSIPAPHLTEQSVEVEILDHQSIVNGLRKEELAKPEAGTELKSAESKIALDAAAIIQRTDQTVEAVTEPSVEPPLKRPIESTDEQMLRRQADADFSEPTSQDIGQTVTQSQATISEPTPPLMAAEAPNLTAIETTTTTAPTNTALPNTQPLSAHMAKISDMANASNADNALTEEISLDETELMSFDDIFTDDLVDDIDGQVSPAAKTQPATSAQLAAINANMPALAMAETPQAVLNMSSPDLGLSVAGPAGGATSAAGLTAATGPAMMPASHPAIAAVSQGIIAAKDTQQGVSVRLDPPEMGRVFIDFAFEDGRVNVVIRSELAETQAFMRSRADEFAAMLKEQGFEGADMQFESGTDTDQSGFAQNDQAARRYSAAQADGAANENITPITTPTAHQRSLAYLGGLDLKL